MKNCKRYKLKFHITSLSNRPRAAISEYKGSKTADSDITHAVTKETQLAILEGKLVLVWLQYAESKQFASTQTKQEEFELLQSAIKTRCSKPKI